MSIIGYDEGDLYATSTSNYQVLTNTVGLNKVILGLFHLHGDASIWYNETLIIDGNGRYQGDENWPSMILGVLSDGANSITSFSAGFGGWAVGDFGHVKDIYENHNLSFSGTQLESNFQVLARVFSGAISTIDMDMENTYDQPSFVAFCQMVSACGFEVTFCPYAEQDFWVDCLKSLNNSKQNPVFQWNLQCYAGGADNDPAEWAKSIQDDISGFNINGFIVVSGTVDQTPEQLQCWIAPYSGNKWLGGCFLWRFSSLLGDSQQLQSFIQAIQNGLNGVSCNDPP